MTFNQAIAKAKEKNKPFYKVYVPFTLKMFHGTQNPAMVTGNLLYFPATTVKVGLSMEHYPDRLESGDFDFITQIKNANVTSLPPFLFYWDLSISFFPDGILEPAGFYHAAFTESLLSTDDVGYSPTKYQGKIKFAVAGQGNGDNIFQEIVTYDGFHYSYEVDFGEPYAVYIPWRIPKNLVEVIASTLGIMADGGGTTYQGNTIPPREPVREILAGIIISEIADNINNAESKELQVAAFKMISSAAQNAIKEVTKSASRKKGEVAGSTV